MLTVACDLLDLEKATQLLAAGAYVNCQDSKTDTPLICAVDGVHVDAAAALILAEMLLRAGASLEIHGWMDKTAFLKACSRGNLKMVQLLVVWGADVKAVADTPRYDGFDFVEMFGAPPEMREYVYRLCRLRA